MALHFDFYPPTTTYPESPSHEDLAPLVPGVFDLDPCAPSPVNMTYEFEPLHYECKKLGQKSKTPAPPTPRLISSEWSQLKGADFGLGLFEPETHHIEDVCAESSTGSGPPMHAPIATRPHLNLKPSPLNAAPSPSLLRAPRLPTRPLLVSSPNSPLLLAAADSSSAGIIPPIEGTRPCAPPRFSALGLDLTAAETTCLPSPPSSPTAGRGRRRPRASTIERSQDEERGRTRCRGRRTETDDDLPGLTYSHDDRALHERVADWSCAVAAATHSGPSTPPDAPVALPLYDEIELATALGRLNADSVGPVRIPTASLPEAKAMGPKRASSLQPFGDELVATELGPWAARVGQSRGRLINMPRLQRAATSPSIPRLPKGSQTSL